MERDIELWPIPAVGAPFPADASSPDARIPILPTLGDASIDTGPPDLTLQEFDSEKVFSLRWLHAVDRELTLSGPT